ncbi:MAG TPA: dihydrofolate reductase family protein [Anaerolineales bacterium]|nr:dihydrofolate reductase family protein [Anaerolineales bacterium]
MAKVFAEMSMSLDGFIAGPNVSANNPLGDNGERLHDWMFAGKSSTETEAYEVEKFKGMGAGIMGRTMLDLGIGPWGENPTFHMPIFVLSHEAHKSITKQGGTTYYFVTGGIERALKQAEEAADGKDIMVLGGANAIQQFIRAGLLDELEIHLIATLLDGGIRLFDNLGALKLEKTAVKDAPAVTHLRYKIAKKLK